MECIEKIKELIQRDNLGTKDRYRDLIYKRSYLYAILRDEGWHLARIGKLFNRNHATVINALKIHDQFYGHDKLYDRTIRHYMNELGKEMIELNEDKSTIFQDIINCYNTTECKLIKERIQAGYYDK
jgi:hypothetical protein